MKKILFVINSLTIGGSEKSLISLLNSMDYEKYEVDLLMFKKGEDFDRYINPKVRILDSPNYYRFLQGESHNINLVDQLRFAFCRLKTSISLRLRNGLQSEQILYRNQSPILDNIKGNYDVAIAYSQGFPTYFVAEKIEAKKKIAWINCDYATTGYDKDFDELFYRKFDKIVAVSETIKRSIGEIKPQYQEKLEVVLDIVSPELIENMANEQIVFEDKSSTNLLTVARLVVHYKGYDIAIKAARRLKDNGYNFKWYVVGDGEHRNVIEQLIKENDLENYFILLGKKINPYPYMKHCDIYVQPSRKEGFGLTVVEAKILEKPIVCTNFNTAKELIKDGYDGTIVDIDDYSLYLGVKRYLDDRQYRNDIESNLHNEDKYSSLCEINKIYKMFNC